MYIKTTDNIIVSKPFPELQHTIPWHWNNVH